MGYYRHHAIVVTSMFPESIAEAHRRAYECFVQTPAQVTAVTPVAINGYQSFFVAPDGSKEGWFESDVGNAAREQFQAYLRDEYRIEWVVVEFGGDDKDTMGVEGPYGRLRGRVDDA